MFITLILNSWKTLLYIKLVVLNVKVFYLLLLVKLEKRLEDEVLFFKV